MWLIDRLKGLPPGRRIVLAILLIAVAAMVAVGAMGFLRDMAFAKIAGIGGMIVVLPVMLMILRSPPSDPLFSGLGSFIGGVRTTDPEQEREVKKFKEHLDRTRDFMKSSGKSLYDIPWYLLIGNASCGKTEMVRRSGLAWVVKDLAKQGEGGTEFFDLWPSDAAVMIDTAGRMVNEGGPVWDQFLAQLKKARPRCPINGVVLAVSSKELLETDDQNIPSMGAKMQQKLSDIQLKLGVRFPVYIVVTKSDLITGFGALCSRIDDSDMQAQIIGWSEPRPLTSQPEPRLPVSEIRDLLAPFFDTIRRKRLGMLLNPGAIDGGSRRIDKVDRAYELPSALEGKLARRLQRYIEAALTFNQSGSGGAAERPLFIRGIYFTTSMQEGREFDEELAKALGIPPSKLPRSENAESSRPYFIGDLLRKKIFPEKGLVTGVANVGRYVIWRRVAILGSALLLCSVLGFGSWYSYGSLRDTADKKAAFWKNEAAATLTTREKREESKDRRLAGPATEDRAKVLNAHFQDPNANRVVLPFPFNLVPVKSLKEGQIQSADNALIDAWLVEPVINASSSALKNAWAFPAPQPASTTPATPAGPTRETRLAALGELLKMEVLARKPELLSKDVENKGLRLDLIAAAVAKPSSEVAQILQSKPVLDRTKFVSSGWPPKTWEFGADSRHDDLNKALTEFSKAWDNEFTLDLQQASHERMRALLSLKTALAGFKSAEDALSAMATRTVSTKAEFDSFKQEWDKQCAALQSSSTSASAAITQLRVTSNGSFADLLQTAVIAPLLSARRAEIKSLLSLIADPDPKSAATPPAQWLADVRTALIGKSTTLEEASAAWEKSLATKWREDQILAWKSSGIDSYWGSQGLTCDTRAKPYLDALALLKDCEPSGKSTGGSGWTSVKPLWPDSSSTPAAEDAGRPAAVKHAMSVAARRKAGAALDEYWAKTWSEPLADKIKNLPGDPSKLAKVPLTGLGEETVDARYRPDLAKTWHSELAASTDYAAKSVGAGGSPIMEKNFAALTTQQTDYIGEYSSYWLARIKPIQSPALDAASDGDIRSTIAIQDQFNDTKTAISARRDAAAAAVAAFNPQWTPATVPLRPIEAPLWKPLTESIIALRAEPSDELSKSWRVVSSADDILKKSATASQLVTEAPYWNELSRALLDRSARAISASVNGQISLLQDLASKFPITRSSSHDLTPDECARVTGIKAELSPWRDADFANAGEKFAPWKSTADAVKAVSFSPGGLSVSAAANQPKWKISLVQPDEPIRAKLASGDRLTESKFREVHLLAGGATTKLTGATVGTSTPCEVSANAPSIELRLYEGTGDEAKFTPVSLGTGTWRTLRILVSPDVRVVSRDGSSATVLYPANAAGQTYWIPIRVEAPSSCGLDEWLKH